MRRSCVDPCSRRGTRWWRWVHRRSTDLTSWRRGPSSPNGLPRSRTPGVRHSSPPAPRTTPPRLRCASPRRRLADARTREAQARKAETEATASHERVRAALKGLQTRLGELTASLFDAPSDSDAQAQLAQIAELTATSRTADAAADRGTIVKRAGRGRDPSTGSAKCSSVAGIAQGSRWLDRARCTGSA